MAILPVLNSSDMAFSQSISERLSALLTKAKSGQEAAFTELYNLYFEKIYRFIYYRTSHKQVAEDLAEEVFIRAFQNIGNLASDGAFESWLYQIARNQVIDYYRSKKVTVPLEEVENTLEYETNVIDVVNLQLQQKIFIKLLRELTTEQQLVIKLKFLEDLTNSEIAALLDKNEGTVRVIQHRAITKLKQLIQKLNLPTNETD